MTERAGGVEAGRARESLPELTALREPLLDPA